MQLLLVRRILILVLLLLTACTLSPFPANTSTTPPSTPTPNPYGKEVIARYRYPEPRGLATGFGSLWVDVFGDSLYRVDPSTGQQQAVITAGIGKEPAQMLATQDALWLINSQSATIARIDPQSNTVTASLKFGDICCSLAEFDGGVWTIDAKTTLSRVDIKTNAITASTLADGTLTNGPFVGNGVLWVEVDNNNLVSFDPSTQAFGTRLPYQGAPLGFAQGLFWTVDDHAVYGMDPVTGKVSAKIDAAESQVARFGFTGTYGDGQLGAVDGSSAWLIGLDALSSPLLVKVDLVSQKLVAAIHVDPPYYGMIAILVDGHTIWLADDHNQVLKVQP